MALYTPSWSPARNACLTRRSSPEWNVRRTTLPPGRRHVGRLTQQGVERPELVVHRDAERLEHAAHGVAGYRLAASLAHGMHDGDERLRGDERRPSLCGNDRRGQFLRERLVGILDQQLRQLRRSDPGEQFSRGRTAGRVHPHVQRAGRLEAEPARGVVDLHRRDPQVGEQHIDAARRSDCRNVARAAKFVRRTTSDSGGMPQLPQSRSVRGSSIGSASSPSSRPPGCTAASSSRA